MQRSCGRWRLSRLKEHQFPPLSGFRRTDSRRDCQFLHILPPEILRKPLGGQIEIQMRMTVCRKDSLLCQQLPPLAPHTAVEADGPGQILAIRIFRNQQYVEGLSRLSRIFRGNQHMKADHLSSSTHLLHPPCGSSESPSR